MARESFVNTILAYVKLHDGRNSSENSPIGLTAAYIATELGAQRSNVSAALNELYRDGKLEKIEGKQVRYIACPEPEQPDPFKDGCIGLEATLKKSVMMAKAAVIYPPHGLHSLLVGQTGVGKTMFAEMMYRFAIQNGTLHKDAPFITFNCAEYANNPQLLLSHLFGYVRGAFTGADHDHDGMVRRASGGVLLLDEIHRLSPEGQEMLFHLIDKNQYSPLGSNDKYTGDVLLIAATTQSPNEVLLNTFLRRIPVVIEMPPLRSWTLAERMKLILKFLANESERTGRSISISKSAAASLLLYDCIGNIGQLKSDIQLASAKAFLNSVLNANNSSTLVIHYSDLSASVRSGLMLYEQNMEKIAAIFKSYNCFFDDSIAAFSSTQEASITGFNIYSIIDRGYEMLESGDTSKEEAKALVFFELITYCRNCLKSSPLYRAEKKNKLLEAKVNELLGEAGKYFKRTFSNNAYEMLLDHLERAISMEPDPKYDFTGTTLVKQDMHDEYLFTSSWIKKQNSMQGIALPAYEAVFIALLLRLEDHWKTPSIAIILAQYGEAAASSTAKVVKELTGANNIYPYDRLLNKSFKVVYNELKALIEKVANGGGVLILADSSTFGVIGQLIAEECKLDIRTIEQISAPLAVAAVKYSFSGDSLEQIVMQLGESLKSSPAILHEEGKERVIVTLCLTGEGSADALKNIILTHLGANCNGVSILPMAISKDISISERITHLMKEKHVVAVVGTSNPKIHGVPFIPISELILNNNYSMLHHCLELPTDNVMPGDDYVNLFQQLKDEITGIDIDKFSVLCVDFLEDILKHFTLEAPDDTIHLIMHLACNLSWRKNGDPIPNVTVDPDYILKHQEEYQIVKSALSHIEKEFDCEFSEKEVIFLLMIILQQ